MWNTLVVSSVEPTSASYIRAALVTSSVNQYPSNDWIF